MGSDDSEVLIHSSFCSEAGFGGSKFSTETLLVSCFSSWSTWVAISLVTFFKAIDEDAGLMGEAGMWLLTVIGTDSRDRAGVNFDLLGEDCFGGEGLGKFELFLFCLPGLSTKGFFLSDISLLSCCWLLAFFVDDLLLLVVCGLGLFKPGGCGACDFLLLLRTGILESFPTVTQWSKPS